MPLLTLDAIAEATGTDVETIRHYEEIGLLATPDGNPGKRVVYDELAVKRLLFIRHWRELGTDLSAIGDLMKLVRDLNEPDELMNRMKLEMQQELKQQQSLLAQLREQLRGALRF